MQGYLKVIDHTDVDWQKRWRRTNGAETYSKDIVKMDIPAFKKLAHKGMKIVVSTCPRFQFIDPNKYGIRKKEVDIAIQYMHTFPHENPIGFINDIKNNMPFKAKKLVFVSAYRSFVNLMRQHGYNAEYVPMRINPEFIHEHKHDGSRHEKKVIYFGNIYTDKAELFNKLADAWKDAGFEWHCISENKYQGRDIDQAEAWKIISGFKYGIGVGRCALEMMELGLRVMIAGNRFGGICPTVEEIKVQAMTNFNGRVTTYDYSIDNCIAAMQELQEYHTKHLCLFNARHYRAVIKKYL